MSSNLNVPSLPKYKENFKFYFKVLEKKKYYKGFTDNYNYKINLKNISYLTKSKSIIKGEI